MSQSYFFDMAMRIINLHVAKIMKMTQDIFKKEPEQVFLVASYHSTLHRRKLNFHKKLIAEKKGSIYLQRFEQQRSGT